MKRYLFELSVAGISEESYADFTSKIHDQGSDQPRAVLAYTFSILQLMQTRASSAFCPIIIDSPIQQEQDAVNHQRILEFIKKNQPNESQLILGVVDTKNVDFSGDVITLNQKRHVLREDEYNRATEEMMPFIRAAPDFRPPEHELIRDLEVKIGSSFFNYLRRKSCLPSLLLADQPGLALSLFKTARLPSFAHLRFVRLLLQTYSRCAGKCFGREPLSEKWMRIFLFGKILENRATIATT